MVRVVKVESAEDLTEKQEEILVAALNDPDKSDTEIASETDSSVSYVRDVRNDLEDQAELADSNDGGSAGFVILLILALAAVWWATQNGLI